MKKYLILLTVLCLAATMAFGVLADDANDFVASVLTATNVKQPEAVVTLDELQSVVNGLAQTSGKTAPTVSAATRADAVKALYDVANGTFDLTAKNEVLGMADVYGTEAYYAAARAFMQAGIITGYNDYAAFKANNNVKRYELALMVDRLLNPAERVEKTYVLYSTAEPYYVIDDFLISNGGAGYNTLSGWIYDYTGSKEIAQKNAFLNTLSDYRTDDDMSMYKYITTQAVSGEDDDGILVFEAIYDVAYGRTFHFEFYNVDGAKILSAGWNAGTPYITGTNTASGAGEIKSAGNTIRVAIDLLNSKAKLWMNAAYVGEASIDANANIAKVRMATGLAETGVITYKSVHMYKNYEVNDVFRLEAPGSAPVGYEVSGATVETINSNPNNHEDNESLKITSGGYANKTLDKTVGGKVVSSAFVLVREGTSASYTLKSGDYEVVKMVAEGDTWTANGTTVCTYNPAVWQQIRIEADLDAKTAVIKVNGRERTTVAIGAKVKNITDISLKSESGEVWFDDVDLFLDYEVDDYVPTPQVLDTGDYILSMSSCNLWRNGSHYGWELISPYPELEPITGFYDEGNPEAMDWEIKFLVEHGITNYALCWYPITRDDPATQYNPDPPRNAELKKSRMSDALHDGFFNAKYSNLMTYNLMFENSGYDTEHALEDFKEHVWPYMIEWYFSDPRYLTVENTAGTLDVVFTVYQYNTWVAMAGGTNALSAELIEWMQTQLKNASIYKNGKQITGVIFNFGGGMQHQTSVYQNYYDAGAENVIIYAWGKNYEIAGTPEEQKKYALYQQTGKDLDGNTVANGTYGTYGSKINKNDSDRPTFDVIALPAAAFNDIAWADGRTRTMTKSEFKGICEWYKNTYMPNQNSNMGKFIQFDTWNEFGEGHYFYPTVAQKLSYVATGYGYLDAIAEVFGTTTHDTALDVTPTAAQKNRVGHLYPATGNYNIARQHIAAKSTIEDELVKYSMDFAKSPDSYMGMDGHGEMGSARDDWHNSGGTSYFSKKEYYQTLDGFVYMQSLEANAVIDFATHNIAASDVKYIEVNIGTDTNDATLKMEVYVNGAWKELGTVNSVFRTEGTVYKFSTESISGWSGNITDFRITVSKANTQIYIYTINYIMRSHLDIIIDNVTYSPCDFSEIQNDPRSEETTTSEIYIAPQQWQGLYQKLHILYEYDRANGVLKLEGSKGNKITFTVNSSSATVDGTSKTLSKAVTLYDSVPVIPLKFVLDNMQISYDASTDGKLYISVANAFKDTSIVVENGNAESATPVFTGYQNQAQGVSRMTYSAAGISTQPSAGGGSYLWHRPGSDSGWNNIEFAYNFELGVSYTIDFDVYIKGFGADGATAGTSTVALAVRNNTGENSGDEKGVGTMATVASGSWQHVTYTFTVPAFVDSLDQARIGIFVNPYSSMGAEFCIDNVVIK